MLTGLFEDDDGEASLTSFHPATNMKDGSINSIPKRKTWKSASYYNRRPERGYVGLLNQGATCYLNSLIQCLYMTPEFRSGIFRLAPEELGVDPSQEKENLKNILSAESEPAKSIVKETKETNTSANGQTAAPPKQENIPKQEPPKNNEESWKDDVAETLLAMGFEESIVKRARKVFPSTKDAQRLIDWCLSHTGEEEVFEDVSLEETENKKLMGDSGLPFTESEPTEITALFEDIEMGKYSGRPDSTPAPNPSPEVPRRETSSQGNSGNPPISEKESKSEIVSVPTPITAPTQTPSSNPNEKKKRKVLIEFQRLFSWLQKIDQSAVSTEYLTNSFGWKGNEVYQQHDVHELNRSLKGTSDNNLISNLYRGVVVNKVICLSCGRSSEREEYFQDVTLLVKGMRSVNESLENYVTFETLTGDNQYQCDNCNRKSDAQKGAVFREFPPFVIFSLSRFEYDWQQDQRKKINSKYAFPLAVDLFPYTEKGRHLLQASSVQNSLDSIKEKEITKVESEKNSEENPEPPTKGKGGKKNKNKSKNNSENKSESNNDNKKNYHIEQPPITNLDSPYIYELYGVVIHSGGAYGGHYHAYIRDINFKGEVPQFEPEDPTYRQILSHVGLSEGVWFDFDDSTVKNIPTERLASQYGGSRECAYMLYYRRRDLTPKQVEDSQIPEYCNQDLSLRNEFMQSERKKYEDAMNEIELQISTPYHYQIVDGMLSVRPRESPNSENAPKSVENEKEKTLRKITIDKRFNLDQLKLKIKETFGEDVPDVSNMVLTEVATRDNIVHVYRSIDQSFDSKLSLKDLAIKERSVVVVWNGKDINGQTWRGEGQTVHIQVRYYSQNTKEEEEEEGEKEKVNETEEVSSEFMLEMNETQTIKDLRDELADRTKIPIDQQHVSKVEHRTLIVLREEYNYKTLFEADFLDETKITVELKGSSRVQGREKRTTTQNNSKNLMSFGDIIEVFVTDRVTKSENPILSMKVEVEQDITVRELKKRIISLLPGGSQINESEVRLARNQLGGPGTPYNDESVTILDAGIYDGERVVVESGTAEGISTIHIQFVVAVDGRITSVEPYELSIDKRSSILDCKTTMAALIFKDPETFRLRTTDYLGEPDKLLDDEEATLENFHLKDGDILWLEEGKPPVKGQITVTFQLYNTFDVDDILKGIQVSVSAIADIKVPRPLILSSPGFHLSSTYRASTHDNYFITPLFTKDISSNLKLSEVKELLIKDIALQGLESPKMIRIWHEDRLLRKETLSLKRQGINKDATLTVQITTLEIENTATPDSTLLYVHKRDPQLKSFSKPTEIYFEGTLCSELRKFLATKFGIPTESLMIAKFNKFNRNWQVFIDEEKTSIAELPEAEKSELKPLLEVDSIPTGNIAEKPGETEKSKEVSTENMEEEKKGKNKQKNNLRGKPYTLRDGDVIAIKNILEDPENKDDFTIYQAVIQNKKENEGDSKQPASTYKWVRTRAPEVALKIDVDFE